MLQVEQLFRLVVAWTQVSLFAKNHLDTAGISCFFEKLEER